MRATDFVRKWGDSTLRERQASQEHFLDLCELLGEPKPAADDPHGERYLQWGRRNGALPDDPVLSSLDQIENRDALLNPDGAEAAWPRGTQFPPVSRPSPSPRA